MTTTNEVLKYTNDLALYLNDANVPFARTADDTVNLLISVEELAAWSLEDRTVFFALSTGVNVQVQGETFKKSVLLSVLNNRTNTPLTPRMAEADPVSLQVSGDCLYLSETWVQNISSLRNLHTDPVAFVLQGTNRDARHARSTLSLVDKELFRSQLSAKKAHFATWAAPSDSDLTRVWWFLAHVDTLSIDAAAEHLASLPREARTMLVILFTGEPFLLQVMRAAAALRKR